MYANKIPLLGIILLTSLMTTVCYGQDRFGLKIYQNTDIFSARYYDSRKDETTKHNYTRFSRISVAFDIYGKNRLMHEIEVLIPEIERSIHHVGFPLAYEFTKHSPPVDNTISTYSLRYEVSKILTEPSEQLTFSAGVGVNPYLTYTEYPGVDNIYYPVSTRFYGASINLTPRINFKVTKRIGIDLNVPFKLYDFQKEVTKIENPNIPIRHQTQKETNHVFLENAYTIRFGVSFLLK